MTPAQFKKQFPDYLVTRYGTVYSYKWNDEALKAVKLLRPDYNIKGYQRVTLYGKHGKKRFFVHRLVAIVYLPNPKGKPEVNHKDENIHNNRVENLEWVTSSENRIHAHKARTERLKKNSPF